MKKILLAVLCCILCVSFDVNAKVSNEFLCNSYKDVEQLSKEEVSEKFFLLDDYLTYLDGGKYLIPWGSLSIDEKFIFNMSIKQLEKLGKHLTNEKEKQDFQEMIDAFPKIREYMQSNAQIDVKTSTLAHYVSYTEKHCSADIKEKIVSLKQKVIEEEKELFSKRTNGKKLHYKPLEYFTLTNQPVQPSEKFIYKYEAEYNPAVPAIRLRVLQVVPSGVLVQADGTQNEFLKWYGTSADKTIFVETNEIYVDKDLLHSGFYEYVGTKSYNNFFGNRTIHSFREIPNPFKALLFYNGNE